MTRSQLREHVFKLLFRVEFHPAEDMEEQELLYFDEEPAVSESEFGEIKARVEKILPYLPKIDESLNENIEGWDVTRIGKVELAILRLAVFEILYDERVPEGVAINEAVELAKKYGPSSSASFINGILAKYAT